MKAHQSWKFSSSAINVPLHGCGIVSSRCSSDNMPFFRRSVIFWKRLVPGYQLSPFCNPTTLSMWPMWKGEALLPLAKVTLCYKVFTTPGSLRNHTKIHTGATSCPVCSRHLATVSSLNRHMKSEHREALDAIWADRSIKALFQNHIVSLVPSPPKTLWMNWRCVAFQATTGATTNIRLLGRAQLGSNISVQHVTTLREAPWNDKFDFFDFFWLFWLFWLFGHFGLFGLFFTFFYIFDFLEIFGFFWLFVIFLTFLTLF